MVIRAVGITTCAKVYLVLNFLTPDWVVLNLLTPDWVETHTEPAHYHGFLLLRLGTHTKPEAKPNQRRTQNQPAGYHDQAPAMIWDHAVSWGRGV